MKEGEKMHLSTKASRKLINIATIVCGIAIVLLVIYWYRLGIFTDQAKMRAYLANKQIVGPIIFVLIQIVQVVIRSEEHTSELQSRFDLVCRLLLEKT